jgi:CubicO group peptidase (beta-lactamase class C family)
VSTTPDAVTPPHDLLEGPSADTPLLAGTRRALAHRLARSQAECRLPSLVGAVAREDRLVWSGAAGTVGGQPPSRDTRYRIGSITKTLTAVLVMRLRDEGRLALQDRLDDHVPGTPLGDRTIASLLSHTSGLQAETTGDWWERTPGGSVEQLRASLTDDVVLHPADRVHHYSNLGYGLLGAVVEHHRGRPWMDAVRDELLAPLEMRHTSYGPVAPHAEGWAVHPWADTVLSEPSSIHDAGAMAPAGQLWASITDLARWGCFLAGDVGDVLDADTLEEMCEPAVVHDEDWTAGHGLGVQVFRRGDRIWVGHGGSMPGFLALLFADREQRAVACVATNATSGIDAVAADMLDLLVTAEPRLPAPWRPARVPHDVLDLLGPWYWGPAPLSLRWREGVLRIEELVGRTRASRFERNDDGTWTGLDGYYRGETLRAVRTPDGAVSHLELATFVFTRTPYAPDAPVPGGVDPRGWAGGDG